MISLWVRDQLLGRRIKHAAHKHVENLARRSGRMSREQTATLLEQFRKDPDSKVHLGKTMWGESVDVPLTQLIKACGLSTGVMGSGKTYFACLLVSAILERFPSQDNLSFGVVDAKGELFERALYLIGRRLESLQGAEREALLERIVVIDFSSREAISPYNLLVRWPYTDPDFFVTSRLETLRELLPASEKLSLRGTYVLRQILTLLAEFGLPLTYLEAVLSNDALRQKLLLRSKNPSLRGYFQRHFANEGKQTIGALRARMDETLLASEGVRLTLSGSTAPDFRMLQNEGKIVLINCAGPFISRGVRLLLQGLVLSDIRQAIFARSTNPRVTYLWCADEAQNFFLTKQQQDNMTDVLTMARSFGSFFYFLCQNLSTAVPDSRILELLHTNIRWSLSLRGTPRDAQFLRPALPVTGRVARPDANPYRERTFYSPEEERSILLDGIAHLPDRIGYLWLKTHSPMAIKLQTAELALPEAEEFREAVDRLKNDPGIGGRVSREAYMSAIARRDREYLGDPEEEPVEERWEKEYQRQEAACQS